MNTRYLLSALLIFPFSLWATDSSSDWTATSALQFQQLSDTRVSVGDNVISFVTSDTERMTIDASGNVGIGTSSPSNIIDVRTSTSSGWVARFAEVNGAGLIFGVDPYSDDPLSGVISHTSSNRNIKYQVHGIGKHIFETSVGVSMAINSSGNVGIGTTTPNSELEVKSAAGNDSELHVNTTSDGGHSIIRFQDAGTETWGFLSNYPQSGKFSLYNYQNSTNAMVIDQNGNIGIGTTDPGAFKLNVNGNIRATTYADIGLTRPSLANTEGLFIKGVDGNGYANFHFATEGWSGSHAILFNAYRTAAQVSGSLATTGNTKYTHNVGNHSNGAGMIHFSANGGAMLFYISPTSTGADTNVDWGTPKMYIKRSGTVAINTISPNDSYKLHVNGDAYANTFITDANTYADFVFEDDYELPTLDEVETFIEKNNHLPDIPSEAEAKANGVDLQEMQAKLLQKIEELTLYVIEQNKQLEGQNKRMSEMEKENKQQQAEITNLKSQFKK